MCHTTLTNAFVAIGANLASSAGKPQVSVPAAMAAVGSEAVQLVAESSLYVTPCMPAGAGPDYVNAVFQVATDLPPEGLLAHLQSIEARFGRERRSRWAARTMDLDLLTWGDTVFPDRPTWRAWVDLPPERRAQETPDQLIVPHPRLQERGFVLVPWAEIAPDWRHPGHGQTIGEMLRALPEAERIGPKPLGLSESPCI